MSERIRETTPALVVGEGEQANEAGRVMMKHGTPDFASDNAAEAWIKAGQPPLPAKGTGKDGTITVPDVTAAAKEA